MVRLDMSSLPALQHTYSGSGNEAPIIVISHGPSNAAQVRLTVPRLHGCREAENRRNVFYISA